MLLLSAVIPLSGFHTKAAAAAVSSASADFSSALVVSLGKVYHDVLAETPSNIPARAWASTRDLSGWYCWGRGELVEQINVHLLAGCSNPYDRVALLVP